MDSTSQSLAVLEQRFDELLQHTFTEVIDKPNIFEIAGFPHFENVISNCYAFFLDPKGPHGLKDLFLSSLVKIINDKKSKAGLEGFEMESCQVIREYPSKNGFIDLLIYEEGLKNKYSAAIILENKIYAQVYNNLDDYYDSIEVEKDGSKVGVLITLQPIKDLNKYTGKEYISLTHQDWIAEIKKRLGNYILKADGKTLMLLMDFIENLENMVMQKETPDFVKYFIENGSKIDKLIEFKKKAWNYLFDRIGFELAKEDTKWKWVRGYPDYLSISYKGKKRIWCYIYLEQVYAKRQYNMDLWIKGSENIERWEEHKDALKNRLGNSQKLLDIRQGTEWLKFGKSEYSELEQEEIENFGERVMKDLKCDWGDIVKDISEILGADL
jgi:PD-(D/E)XK nuclease superfamily